MRVLTDPAETGAVTLALPQDVQAEADDFPDELFDKRVWRVRRPLPEPDVLAEAVALIRGARRPLIVTGGGTIYAEATDALAAFARGDRHRRGGDAGGQGLTALRPSAGARRDRPYRHDRRQRRGPRGRRGARRRHALERLHDRCAHAVLRRRGLHQPQRRDDRLVQARRTAPGGRRPARARRRSTRRSTSPSRRRPTTGTRSSRRPTRPVMRSCRRRPR